MSINIEAKLDNTTISLSTTYHRELNVELSTDKEDVRLLLISIIAEVGVESLFNVLEMDEMKEISEKYEENLKDES